MTDLRLDALAAALALAASPALAQPAAPQPLASPNPSYSATVLEIDVARPAAEVWRRIGKYCDIQEWYPGLRCELTAGKDGEPGAVRTLNGSTQEILVARKELSYAYTQPVRVGQVYNLYHGAIEARPVTPTSSKLVYSLLLDNSMLGDDAARKADYDARKARFEYALRNMKILAEGGTLPPPAPAR